MEQLRKRVEAALESIRPYLHHDGGDVILREITEDRVVRLSLTGACESCSMSAMTLRAGIEEAIRKVAPEVTKVEAVS